MKEEFNFLKSLESPTQNEEHEEQNDFDPFDDRDTYSE